MNREVFLPKDALAKFCRERGIRRLAVFGSALRADFGPDSDIDLEWLSECPTPPLTA